jgi:hypothetical protein
VKVLHVTWIDSETTHGWEPVTDVSDSALSVFSVGFLIKETPEFICLCHSYDTLNENYNGGIKIPIAAIQEVRTICTIPTTKT